MREAHHFDSIDEVAVFRPRGRLSLEQAIRLVKSAIAAAREQQLRELLIVTTGLEGFDSPSVAMRHFLAREWATAADGVVRLAFVARPEMIDPEKFGVMVAKNFGVSADVFASEAEALVWLRDMR